MPEPNWRERLLQLAEEVRKASAPELAVMYSELVLGAWMCLRALGVKTDAEGAWRILRTLASR